MVLIGPLMLLLIVLAVAGAVTATTKRHRSTSPRPEMSRSTNLVNPRPTRPVISRATRPASTPMPTLQDELAQWVAAGLITQGQADEILAREQATPPTPPAAVADRPVAREPAASPRSSKVRVVAEALGYLGGVLAIVGLTLVVARYWPDMATPARLAIAGGGAVAFVVAGALVHEQADAALARTRWFLWLLSTAATVLFAGIAVADGYGTEAPETIALGCAAAGAVQSAALWQWRMRPVQQLTTIVGAVVLGGVLVAQWAGPVPVGLTVWTLGAGLVTVGLRRWMALTTMVEVLGAAAMFVGAVSVVGEAQGVGLLFLVATGGALVAFALVRGLAPRRADQIALGVLGSITLLQGAPPAIVHFAHDAGALTGLVVWLGGVALLVVGDRRLVRFGDAVELDGGLMMIGGAALVGVQWSGVAPIAGIATALGLLGIGMLPGRVLLSVLGSLGLLVNIPWAIGRFFPGEGRAPVLILVSGALILLVAVLMTRLRGRFRRELGSDRDVGSPSVDPGGGRDSSLAGLDRPRRP